MILWEEPQSCGAKPREQKLHQPRNILVVKHLGKLRGECYVTRDVSGPNNSSEPRPQKICPITQLIRAEAEI